MPTISTCPRCSRMVTIPERLDGAALVRCPLCSAEYPLNEALELALPELIPVATAEVKATGPDFPFQFGVLGLQEEGSRQDAPAEKIVKTTESHFDAAVFAELTKQPVKPEEESPAQTDLPFPRLRIKREPKSAVRIFVEIIFGGLVGIVIAYIALAWIMGPRFNLPQPPKALKPVLRFVLPDGIWEEKQQPHNTLK